MFNLFKKKKENNNSKKYSPNEKCITCNHILEEDKPILYIKREAENGEYQFLCGTEVHTEVDIKNVEIGEIAKKDKEIERILPLELGTELKRQYIRGKGLELKKFIQDGINNIIQKDIKDHKVLMTQLYNNGEIVYYNGRNGTWFDWDVNDKTSWFTVCFNDEDRMGYISIAIFKDGTVSGYKWGNYGKDKAEDISLGKLSIEDTEYLVRLLLQQTDDKGIFDINIDAINWETPIFLEPLEGTEEP